MQNAKGTAASAISQHTVQLISLLLLPIAVLMMVYALYIYYMRSRFLEKKQVISPPQRSLLCLQPAGPLPHGEHRLFQGAAVAKLSRQGFVCV